jgi:hypothetical protein
MASRTVRARLDTASEQSLELLMREGLNESEAVRLALTESARRRRQRSALADEVAQLAADPRDRAVRRRLLADMDDVGADWPD